MERLSAIFSQVNRSSLKAAGLDLCVRRIASLELCCSPKFVVSLIYMVATDVLTFPSGRALLAAQTGRLLKPLRVFAPGVTIP